jgi:hypothetical protein
MFLIFILRKKSILVKIKKFKAKISNKNPPLLPPAGRFWERVGVR